jgi:hypothetical protein
LIIRASTAAPAALLARASVAADIPALFVADEDAAWSSFMRMPCPALSRSTPSSYQRREIRRFRL